MYLDATTLNPSVTAPMKEVGFTPYERMGVTVMAVAGVISCTLVSLLLLYIIITAISPWPKRGPDDPVPFTRKQVAVFVICLLISDLIQSISGITQVKWASENKIYEGRACSIQAATLVMGDLGSTVWSCVIAAHTFSAIALRKSWPRWTVVMIVILGWTFAILLTVVPAALPRTDGRGRFFSIAGTWCFISSEYAIQRLGVHYVPLFFAALLIFVLYGLVFLVLRGTINFDSTGRHILRSGSRAEDVFMRERISIAKRMLWYPTAYLTCIFPISIIRLVGLRQEVVPDSVWIFGMFFLYSLGAVDSIIYTTTRKLIKPVGIATHLRHLSDLSSSTKTSSSLSRNPTYKSGYTDLDKISPGVSNEEHPRLDCPPENASPESSKPSVHSSTSDAVIHVTLERIEEVI